MRHEYPDAATVEMMNKGLFTLWHRWTDGDEVTEYWRGAERNGACIRKLIGRNPITIHHFPMPGSALRHLVANGFNVPGVPATA